MVEDDGDNVDAWNVTAKDNKGIDYEKLIVKFGCDRLTKDLIERLEKVTGKRAHRFLRRGIFFCHRDLDVCLKAYE